MRRLLPFLAGCGFILVLAGAPAVHAQKQKDKDDKGKYDPSKSLEPGVDQMIAIQANISKLKQTIADLRKLPKNLDLLPDVEIYQRGAENIVRFKEFFTKDSGKWTLDSLSRGLLRAEQLAKGETPWTKLDKRNVLRAYRSIIDGTAQPYGVTYPLEYGKDAKRRWRVDVVLHGRNANLTEVAFLNSHNGNKKVPADQDWVQIDIFGRGNNAYRWSGETDVLEALEAFFAGEAKEGRGDLLDRRRVVLRGFSMGGAGTWHLGLHYPDKWCVMGPGAGFTTTHGYAWKDKKSLPDNQEKCLHIYDALDYTENAADIPIVAYSGGDDAQKLAADNIENRLKSLKINGMTHLVAPGLGHTFPADWFKKANALWSEHASKGRPDYPAKVAFTTYTLKYPECDWVEILSLEKHYQQSSVAAEAKGSNITVTTKNVRILHLTLDKKIPDFPKVTIDGKEEPALALINKDGSKHLYFTKKAGKWTPITRTELAKDRAAKLQKLAGLQGPIDDAFTSGFVCVLGSGDPWHKETQKFVDARVDAFKKDWAKHWRGELPTTGDYALTPNDIKNKHLILFGDPSSNLTLAQVLPKLPIKWTKDEIEFAGQKFKSAEHVPMLIFPNPLNPNKYVVLNTGHTIPSGDYTKTNAMLYARLGDYAVLRTSGEVALAGLFDEYWK